MYGLDEDYFDYDVHDRRSDYEKREIYDFQVYKPLIIENAIKNKDLKILKDDLMIYSSSVESALSETSFMQSRPHGLDQMLIFLKLAVKSYNLHVLRSVWSYGIEIYFRNRPEKWSEVLLFIADLIYQNENDKMLRFLINKIEVDNKMINLKLNNQYNKLSGAKRKYVFGNLLDAAVYYNNIDAIEMLLNIQPKRESKGLKDYLDNNSKDIMGVVDLNNHQQIFFYNDYYSRNILCSNNPILYAFDNGNIKAIDILIQNGYRINFNTLGFSYELANFADIKTIRYLFTNYPDEFKNLDIDVILKASNYQLIKIILDSGVVLKDDSLNKIFYYSNDFYEFNNKSYDSIKAKNIERCINELVKRNLKFSNIRFPLIYSFYTKSYVFLKKSISLYDSKSTIDITTIISYLKLDIEMLKYLSENINLYCDFEGVKGSLNLGIRDFKKLLEVLDFNIGKSNKINLTTKNILDLNAVTSIKLLYSYGFITNENCDDAVDYIVEQGLEKLLPRLISNFNNLGGLEKNYDI